MSELNDNIKRLESALDVDTTLSNEDKYRTRMALLEAKAGLCMLGKRPAEWVPVTDTAHIDVMDVLEDEQGVYLVVGIDRDGGRIRIKRAD